MASERESQRTRKLSVFLAQYHAGASVLLSLPSSTDPANPARGNTPRRQPALLRPL